MGLPKSSSLVSHNHAPVNSNRHRDSGGAIDHTLDDSRLREVFDGLVDEYWHKLSQWEKNFVESTKDRWERTGYLHPGTVKKLEEIWVKV
jgi:hypothetical protein